MKLTEDLAWLEASTKWKLLFQQARKLNEIASEFVMISIDCPEIFDVETEQGKRHYDLLLKAFSEGNYESLKPLLEYFKRLWIRKAHLKANRSSNERP